MKPRAADPSAGLDPTFDSVAQARAAASPASRPGKSHHKPNWLGKPAAEMRADAAASQDEQPVVERCLFCRWRFKGTVAEGRIEARAHRAEAHPEAVGRRTYRRPRAFRVGEPVDDALIEEARRSRALREEAEKLATIERGRQRREAAA